MNVPVIHAAMVEHAQTHLMPTGVIVVLELLAPTVKVSWDITGDDF